MSDSTPATAAVPVCGITTPHNHSSFDDPIDCAWRDRQPTTAATVHGVWEGEHEADLTCLHADRASAEACAADAERHNGRYVEVHEHRVETAGDHE